MSQEIFQNAQVDLSGIPSASDISWKPLQIAYRRILILSAISWSVFFVVGITIAIPFVNVPDWIPLIVYLLIVLLAVVQLVFIVKGFPYKGYALRQHDILYKSGWLYKQQIAVPFNRIQHVDIRQGIFERAFGLSKLNVYTAGGQSSDITIPGLPEDEAQRLKEYILRETTLQDEEE